jgi:hypothetical protein
MANEVEPISLKLDENNDLGFEVKIEGDEAAIPSFRLVCEAPGITFGFRGEAEGNTVRFNIPAMKGMLKEGTYATRLEVIIGEKLLVPLSFETAFTAPTRITVETIHRIPERKQPGAQARLVSVQSKHKASTQDDRHVIENAQTMVTTKPKIEVPKSVPVQKSITAQPKTQPKRIPTLNELYRAKK